MSTLDAVVVAFASRDHIDRVVDDLTPVVDGRIVVVDNGRDGSGARAGDRGAIVVHRPDNPGFGAGSNAGLALAGADYVLLLNPDAEVDATGVQAGLRYLAGHPDVAAVQGAIVHGATGAAERSHGVELGPVHLLGRALGLRRLARFGAVRRLAARTHLRDHVARAVDGPVDVESLAATAVLARRRAIASVGGFDERYFLYGEDLDLCRRLRATGWRLVALPERFAVHAGGASSEGWWEREVEWWRGTMRFAATWWGTVPWSGAVLAAVLRWPGLVVRRPAAAGAAWRAVVGDAWRARAGR